MLREQRRNQQPQGQGSGSQNNYGRNSFAQSTRKVADPFANVNDENANNQNTVNPSWNTDTSSPYDNQYDDGQSNKFETNNRYQSGGRGGRSGGFNQNNGPSAGGGAFGSSNEMGNDPEYDNYDGGGNGNCNDNWSQSGRATGFRNQNQGTMNRNGRGYRNGRSTGPPPSSQRPSASNMRRSNSQRPPRTNTIKKRVHSQRPAWNDNTTPTQQEFDAPSDPMDNPRLSRSQSTTEVDVQYATADDVKKVLAMVEQLRGQMHALQFQLDNVKMENRKLQQTIGDLEAKMEEQPPPQSTQPPPHHLAAPHDRFSNNGPPPRNNNRRGNRSRDASMDVDLDLRQQGVHQSGSGPSNGGNGGNNGNMRMSQSLRQLKVKQQQSPGGHGNRNFQGNNPRGGFSRNEANGGNNGFDGNAGFGGGGSGGGGFPENDGNTGFGAKMNRGGAAGGDRDRDRDREPQNGGFGGKMNHGLGGNPHDDRQQRFGGGGGGRGDVQNGGFSGGHKQRGNDRNDGFSGNANNGGNGNGFGMNDRNRNGGGGNGGGFGMDAERSMPGHRGAAHQMHNRGGGGGGMGTMNGNGNEEEEEEVQAPPQSTAEDYARRIAEQAAQFGGLQPQENEERIPCHQCGRKFNQKALARHMKICKKVFGQKRKAFNMKQQRADDEALKASRNSNPAVEAELKRKREANKKKWKAQSAMLRNAVRSSKQIDEAMKNGVPLSELPQMESIPVEDTRVQCPHCKRKFADETAKRHIPKCQNIKSRPKALKRRR